jgi:hypothetical protein
MLWMIYIHSFTITHEVSYFIRSFLVSLHCRVCHFILDYIIPSWDVLVASVDLKSRIMYIELKEITKNYTKKAVQRSHAASP